MADNGGCDVPQRARRGRWSPPASPGPPSPAPATPARLHQPMLCTTTVAREWSWCIIDSRDFLIFIRQTGYPLCLAQTSCPGPISVCTPAARESMLGSRSASNDKLIAPNCGFGAAQKHFQFFSHAAAGPGRRGDERRGARRARRTVCDAQAQQTGLPMRRS